MMNFHVPKTTLAQTYRHGLETALAAANFLGHPTLPLVQAFTIFVALVRRQEHPRYVWMLTGLAIRMGQSLGLHRDGSQLGLLGAHEIEMRRRVWWILCMLDVRTAEDQGTEFAIGRDSFDTQMPRNINVDDDDCQDRPGLTDMTLPRIFIKVTEVTRRMMATRGPKDPAPTIEQQGRILKELDRLLEEDLLPYPQQLSTATTIVRLVKAKLTIFISLPVLFTAATATTDTDTEELRTRLLTSSIEVAEYNHVLNEECRNWRWIAQTYTYWYAVVYMLMEIGRPDREWDGMLERAWDALQSPWLMQTERMTDDGIWFPLRRLMARARKRRESLLPTLPHIDFQLDLTSGEVDEIDWYGWVESVQGIEREFDVL